MRRLTKFSWTLLLFFALAIIGIVVRLAPNIFGSSTEKTKKALLDAGYHPISVGGYGWFKCSEDDVFAVNFKAYSPDSSRIVTGCVCSGFMKGSTIRLD